MDLCPLSSKQVTAFLPANTWTEVILLSTSPNKNGVYFISTEEKIKKRSEDMNKISLQCCFYEKIQDFNPFEIVAVKIDNKWLRGKLISYNEFQSDNTRMNLIDYGSVHVTKLENLLTLPYYFLYDPLVLPIKFKNFIPKTTKITVKPHLSESELHEGVVLVETSCYNLILNNQNEKQQTEVKIVNEKLTNGYVDETISSFENLKNSSFHDEKKPYNKSGLKNGDNCIITYFENFSCIYVCKTIKNSTNNNYDVYGFDILVNTVESTDRLLKKNPKINDIVKVLSPSYKDFFRAKILRKDNDKSYYVFYIDYGNTETVPSDVIFELSENLNLPGLAIQVGISDLKHTPNTAEIKNMFEDFADSGKPFTIEFDEVTDICLENVKLKDVDGNSDISNYISKCLPIKFKTEELIQNDENESNFNKKMLNNLKNNDQVYLKHFEDMANVYIVKDVQLFNDVMLNIITDKSNICLSNFIVGDLVKVISKACTYRAKVLNKTKDNFINVFNIDFGFCDKVEKSCIYNLSNDLKKIPGLVLKIGIKGPIIKKTETLLNFINNIEKVPLYVEYDEDNSNKYQEITLRRLDNAKNIFDEFLNTMNQSTICNGTTFNIENKEIATKQNEKLIDDFKNIVIENGDYCIVSYFKNFENIYLCKAINDKANDTYVTHNYNIIMKTMESKDRIFKENLVIGDFVKVFSPTFKDFYRAKITHIEENADFCVSYIDFGNTEVVQSSDIFELSIELKKETKLPIRVSLDVPGHAKITDEVETIFTNLIDNLLPLYIEYKNKDGFESVILKELKSGNSINEKILKLFPVIKKSDTFSISHFENFDSIYISEIKSENKKIVEETMNSTDCKTVVNPVLGDIVKVLSPSFGDFYRARITKIDNGRFKVFYIDFGNTEIVKSSDIFELSENLKIKPGIVTRIGINMASNAKKNNNITKYFLKLIEKMVPISIEYDELNDIDLKNCTLKEISSGFNINNEVSKLLSDSSVISLANVKNVELNKNKHGQLSKVEANEENPYLLKSGEKVIVKHFQDFNSVYVSKGSEEDKIYFLEVMDKISSDELWNKVLNIEVQNIVKILLNGKIYRGKILKMVNEKHWHLSLIDFGNESIIHIENIFELSDDLKKIPGLCVKIGIQGSSNFTKNEIVSNFFTSLKLDTLYIEYDENNPNGLREANLKRKNNCNILDELFKIINESSKIKENSVEKLETNLIKIDEVSKKLKEIDESSIDLKYGDTVFCSHFDDFDSIYLCKGTKENDTPENNNLINDSLKITGKDKIVKKNPKYGETVKVMVGEKLFRAKIIGKSGENFTLFLIDIGKTEIMFADNIFELSDDLKKIPGLAVKVGLKIKKDSKVTEVIKNYFYNLWYNGPVPLIFTYDEDNFNYLNEVVLKKQKDGRDIIGDLLVINNTGVDESNSFKSPVFKNGSKSNDFNFHQYISSGDHFEFLHGNNIDCIFVRHLKLYHEIKHILIQLKEEKKDNLKPILPKIDDLVIANSSKQNGLCRAKVMMKSNDETDLFKCKLIDFGLTEIFSSQNLFELSNHLLPNKVPFTVYKVTLAGLTKINNSKITSLLASFIGKIFIMEFDSSSDYWYNQVVLTQLNNSISMNDEIKNKFLTSPYESAQQRLQRKIIKPYKETDNKPQKSSHPIESGSLVCITHFENFNSIFVRNISSEFIEKFNLFNKQMLKCFMNASKNDNKRDLNIGDKVYVRSLLNMVMFSRATIIDKIDDKYKVFYIDYGNNELVNSDDIFELPDEFKKPQDFVIKVQLQNVPQLTTNNDKKIVADYFKKKLILHNVVLIIEFNEFNPKGLDDVVLKTEIYKNDITHDIKDLLKNNFLENHLNSKNSTERQNSFSTLSPLPARKKIIKN